MSRRLPVFVALAECPRLREGFEGYLIEEIPTLFEKGEVDKIIRYAIVEGEIAERDGMLELTPEGREALTDSSLLKFIVKRAEFIFPPLIPFEGPRHPRDGLYAGTLPLTGDEPASGVPLGDPEE